MGFEMDLYSVSAVLMHIMNLYRGLFFYDIALHSSQKKNELISLLLYSDDNCIFLSFKKMFKVSRIYQLFSIQIFLWMF